jgi:hypothetical protein
MRLGTEYGQRERFPDTNAHDLLAKNYREVRRNFYFAPAAELGRSGFGSGTTPVDWSVGKREEEWN